MHLRGIQAVPGGLRRLLWEAWQRQEARRHVRAEAGRFPTAWESCCGKHGSAKRPEDMRVGKPGGTWRPPKAAVGSLICRRHSLRYVRTRDRERARSLHWRVVPRDAPAPDW